MYEWVNSFPLPTGGTETTVCDGALLYSQNSTTAVDRTTYCSKALASKKYTQK